MACIRLWRHSKWSWMKPIRFWDLPDHLDRNSIPGSSLKTSFQAIHIPVCHGSSLQTSQIGPRQWPEGLDTCGRKSSNWAHWARPKQRWRDCHHLQHDATPGNRVPWWQWCGLHFWVSIYGSLSSWRGCTHIQLFCTSVWQTRKFIWRRWLDLGWLIRRWQLYQPHWPALGIRVWSGMGWLNPPTCSILPWSPWTLPNPNPIQTLKRRMQHLWPLPLYLLRLSQWLQDCMEPNSTKLCQKRRLGNDIAEIRNLPWKGWDEGLSVTISEHHL